VFGPNAASFLKTFCENEFERARELGRQQQEICKGNERALARVAGLLKYINAHLALAQCYGKQIGIMSEHEGFRSHALAYIAVAHAELEALEYFDP
jgi:hypothetical protein